MQAYGASYSRNSQHTKNHTNIFYKGVCVNCIFDFYIPKIEGDMCTASWVFFIIFVTFTSSNVVV